MSAPAPKRAGEASGCYAKLIHDGASQDRAGSGASWESRLNEFHLGAVGSAACRGTRRDSTLQATRQLYSHSTLWLSLLRKRSIAMPPAQWRYGRCVLGRDIERVRSGIC